MHLLATWTLLAQVVTAFVPLHRAAPERSDVNNWTPVRDQLAKLTASKTAEPTKTVPAVGELSQRDLPNTGFSLPLRKAAKRKVNPDGG